MELKLNIPLEYSHLTPGQIRFVSALFLQKYPETEFLLKAFLFLTGLRADIRPKTDSDGPYFVHESLEKPFIIDEDVLAGLVKKCQFLTKPGEIHPVKWIGLARARHYRLYNATFEEYLMAENYYFAYTETQNRAHLLNLISVLYRKPWQKWNSAKIQQRAAAFANLEPETANAVFMWYTGFRWYVSKRCKKLFSGKPSTKAFDARSYINGLVHLLNNGDITLNKKLYQQPLWFALDELEQRAIAEEAVSGS